MNILRAIALGLIAGLFITSTYGQEVQADPAPPVPDFWPSQLGSVGGPLKVGHVQYRGYWAKWSRTTGTVTKTHYVCVLHNYVPIRPSADVRTPVQTARAYWLANVTRDCGSDPELQPLYEAALAAQ